MKRILTAALVSLAVAGCNDRAVTYYELDDSSEYPLAEGRTETIEISFDLDLPEKDGEIAASMENAIAGTLFGSEYTGADMKDAVRKWTSDKVEEYRDVNLGLLESLPEDQKKDPMGSLNWQFMKKGKPAGSFRNIEGYTTLSYAFTGGAHGSSAEMNLNFDRKTGKLLEQEDVLIPGSEDAVSALLLKHLNDNRENGSRVDIYVEKILPNGNFLIGPEGITFTYNQYEIAAYVYGIIDITVPADEIKPYLNPALKLY